LLQLASRGFSLDGPPGHVHHRRKFPECGHVRAFQNAARRVRPCDGCSTSIHDQPEFPMAPSSGPMLVKASSVGRTQVLFELSKQVLFEHVLESQALLGYSTKLDQIDLGVSSS